MSTGPQQPKDEDPGKAEKKEPSPEELRQADLKHQKQIVAHEVALNAWATTAMELDKSLLTLSSGAIALSLTIVTPIKDSDLMLFLYFAANLLFIVTVFCTLAAFKYNKDHISGLLSGQNIYNELLAALDKTAIFCFSIGIVCLFAVGSVSILKSEKPKESQMSQDKSKPAPIVHIEKSFVGIGVPTNESLSGLGGLPIGAQNTQSSLQPQAQTPQPQSQNPNTPARTLGDLINSNNK